MATKTYRDADIPMLATTTPVVRKEELSLISLRMENIWAQSAYKVPNRASRTTHVLMAGVSKHNDRKAAQCSNCTFPLHYP